MPVDGPDWLILMTFTLCVFIPAIFIAKIWKWYASVWNHRLEKVWPAEAVRRRLATTRPTLDTVTRSERKARTEYLRALLDSEEWKPHWPSIKEDAGLTDKDSITVSQDDYEKVSKALIAQIEKAVFDRALAVGFIVGFSRSPWMDQLTILSASFEIQLDVLSRLGKKPNCQMWRLLFKRSLSSLFLNTYLNRDDAFLVQLTIRKIAMGLEVLADLAETGAESLNDIDWDHFLNSLDLDESLEGALHTIDSGHEVGEHIVRTAGGV